MGRVPTQMPSYLGPEEVPLILSYKSRSIVSKDTTTIKTVRFLEKFRFTSRSLVLLTSSGATSFTSCFSTTHPPPHLY